MKALVQNRYGSADVLNVEDIDGNLFLDFAAGIAALDKSATYALYCRSGNRSGKAMEQMAAAGFTHVYDLADGIVAWQNMGGPMATG